MSSTIKNAATADEAATLPALLLAFSADPAVRWAWREPLQYLRFFPEFVRAFGGPAFSHGGAYCVQGYTGTALWLPPQVPVDEEAVVSVFEESLPPETLRDALRVFEAMGRFHPQEPHWYLAVMGVDPSQHGRGVGSALIQPVLDRCDQDRTPAYTESSNARNVSFYERHGFARIGTIQVGTSPPMFPLLRRPR